MKPPYLVQYIPNLPSAEITDEATVLAQEYRTMLEKLLAETPKGQLLKPSEDMSMLMAAIEKRVKRLSFDGHQPKIDLPVIHHTGDGEREIMTFSEAFARFDRVQEIYT